jgi:hypothetical protein
MSINFVDGHGYFVVLLAQGVSAWGDSIKIAISKLSISEDYI